MQVTKPILLAAVLVSTLTACQTTSPDAVKQHLTVTVPTAGTAPYPVVVFLQGTGGGNNRANQWAKQFAAAGIASVAIDNAGLRGRTSLPDTAPAEMAADYAAALKIVQADSRLDLGRHALMGFSKGGTAAIQSGPALAKDQPKPRVVVAFYPGMLGDCSVTVPEGTKTHIYYGSLDEWGAFQGTRDACRRVSQNNPSVTFHSVEGAHHGFDDSYTGSWSASGRTFQSAANPAATAQVQKDVTALLTSTLK